MVLQNFFFDMYAMLTFLLLVGGIILHLGCLFHSVSFEYCIQFCTPSAVMGYCSGMAFRRAGKALGVVIGIGFIGVQTAASMGYIDVDWNKIKDDAIKPLDLVRVKKSHDLDLVGCSL